MTNLNTNQWEVYRLYQEMIHSYIRSDDKRTIELANQLENRPDLTSDQLKDVHHVLKRLVK